VTIFVVAAVIVVIAAVGGTFGVYELFGTKSVSTSPQTAAPGTVTQATPPPVTPTGDGGTTGTAGTPITTPAAPSARTDAEAIGSMVRNSMNMLADVQGALRDATCQNLPATAQVLQVDAKRRGQLVTAVSHLDLSRLQHGTQLQRYLEQAWGDSATADIDYRTWVLSQEGCVGAPDQSTALYQVAWNESNSTKKAKSNAATLWNGYAKQYFVTKMQKDADGYWTF
jgi:hypothetical protein